ncbi:MAG: zinc ABC transporter permease [Bacteroidetes bacterium HGW-Bacteroidetes-4]|jgi:zinc transport system permease protein|nr:MAG: zinc ABC transporter permease [Bacteroidetes bacterium HGW-Bacteroidetes-4]
MNAFLELFQYTFIKHALLAALLSSIICGVLGTYIVSKRMVFISGGITHASFGGIGMAFYLGLPPFLGATIFALLSALGIEWITKNGNIRNDSSIGILWSLGMAIGIIFVYITPGFTPNLMSYLFGSILTVSTMELWIMGTLTAITIAFFVLFFRPILFFAFDDNFAKSQKAPVNFLNYTLILLIALGIVINIKVAGIILVMSMLTLPQNTANLFSNNFKHIIIYSILISFAGTMTGLAGSFWLGIPSGASIIFTLSGIFFLAKIAKIVIEKNTRKQNR